MSSNNISDTADPAGTAQQRPHRLRLPGFIKDQEIGLGDVIKRATYAMGIKPCRVAKSAPPRLIGGRFSPDKIGVKRFEEAAWRPSSMTI